MGATLGFGVDIGGSGIKGCTVDLDAGKLHGERIRIPTPDPSKPDAVADVVRQIVDDFGWNGPVGVTLPAVIKHGVAHTAANIDKSWLGTDAAALFAERLEAAQPGTWSCSTTRTRPASPRSPTAGRTTERASSSC